MAEKLKDMKGWKILITDQNGNIVEDEKRSRSRRDQRIERIVIERCSDGLRLTRGDSVKVRNTKPSKKTPDAFLFRFISDIKLNTLNNVLEIWVFEFVKRNKIDPYTFYKDVNPKVLELNETSEFYSRMFEDEVGQDELFLTLEPSEILLSNFVSKINIVQDKGLVKDPATDLVCRYLCDANFIKYATLDYNKETVCIQDMYFKAIEEHFKNILFPTQPKHDNSTKQKLSPAKSKKITKKYNMELSISSSSESELESDVDNDISSSEEFKDSESNTSIDHFSSEEEDSDEDEDSMEEESEDGSMEEEIDNEKPSNVIRKRGRPKTLNTRSKYVKRTKKPKKIQTEFFIKKFTKKNVVRAKKKYTPFSKKYNSIDDIPNLNSTPGFYQQSQEDIYNLLESKLETKKQHEIVETIFSKVKKQLYSSHGKEMIMQSKDFDDIIPGRENEFASIYLSVYSAIESGSATTVYIAGTPGVGKTLTVREVMREISKSAVNDELPPFSYVEINGLKMVKPTDSYEVLWKRISGESLTWGAAMESLEFYFNKVPQEKKRTMIVLLDELDALVTKGQDIMYNFFNWTTYENAKLIVIAIANTMNLPERQLGNKISSRIGFTRIMFSGYTHEELKTIIDFRLKGLNNSYFYVNVKTGSAFLVTNNEEEDSNTNDGGKAESKIPPGMKRVQLRMSQDAIEIASRKVASVSGDARRALKVCKRATEIAEQYYMNKHGYGYGDTNRKKKNEDNEQDDDDEETSEDTDEIQTVHINHVMKALSETINPYSVKYITELSFTSKLFLFAFLNLIKKTGLQEQTLGNIIDEIKNLIEVNGNNKLIINLQDMLFDRRIPDYYEQLRMISWEYLLNELIEAGLVIKQTMRNERFSCVKLNIPTEDIKNALYQDETLKNL